MPDGHRILVTGIGGRLAGRLARELEARPDVRELYGVDVREPAPGLRRTEFVRADLRDPVVTRLVDTASVDTVVHLGLLAAPGAAGGPARMKEENVIGGMRLLAACQTAASVRSVVLRSTTAVYGSDHADPALFGEDDRPAAPPPGGFARHATEVEGYARTLRQRRPDATVTILRFANLLGGELESRLARYLTLPVVPSVLGYDPRVQFCHADDALAVLTRATTERIPGVFNVAGPGALYLSQCVRRARRLPLPVPLPLARGVAALARRAPHLELSHGQLRFLQFGRVADITRLRKDFGYEPEYPTRAAFDDFLERRGPGRGAPGRGGRITQEVDRW